MRESRVGERITFEYLGGQGAEILGFPSEVRNPVKNHNKGNKNHLLNSNR